MTLVISAVCTNAISICITSALAVLQLTCCNNAYQWNGLVYDAASTGSLFSCRSAATWRCTCSKRARVTYWQYIRLPSRWLLSV
jgi:hypothetical protein